MGYGIYVPGLPGVQALTTATPRVVFRQIDQMGGLAQGGIINGTLSSDSGNDPITSLRAGLLMGLVSSTGLWAPSILGVTQSAYTSGGTSITVTAAQATEIVRRVGASGNLTYVGPPTAAGTVAVTSSIAYSAVNTTTGVITVSSLGVDKIAGTFVTATDGSGIPITLIPDGFPITVVDGNGTRLNVQYPDVPVAGIIHSANIINWPSDTSLRQWIKDKLNANGKFVFDDAFFV